MRVRCHFKAGGVKSRLQAERPDVVFNLMESPGETGRLIPTAALLLDETQSLACRCCEVFELHGYAELIFESTETVNRGLWKLLQIRVFRPMLVLLPLRHTPA